MRTSRVSQDTTRIFNAISPNTLTTTGRSTRSARRIASFALGYNGEVQVKDEEVDRRWDSGSSPLSGSPDIEDAFLPSGANAGSPARVSRKRKLGVEEPVSVVETLTMTRKVKKELADHNIKVKEEVTEVIFEADSTPTSPSRTKSKSKLKKPARRHISPSSGTVTVEPPSNWSEIYNIVKAMRERNPTAPVDTMGCEDLYWRNAPAKERRYHTLTALMLSSQTKDTVTAVAMQRLHKELVPDPSATRSDTPFGEDGQGQSMLTVDNILACSATHLDSLIGKVGFHNNKTKYIKQTASVLKEQYDGDIPDTIAGLVSLPGVGPKMGYLCLSAAWGVDEGIGVDVHVHRITNMWGWQKSKTPEETRAALESWLPKDRWHAINKLLVGLGQTVCLPVGRRCGECDLAGTGLCKAEIRGWKPVERRVKKMEVKVEVKEEEQG